LKTAVFAFGRMNPPTIGHKKLVDKVSSIPGDHFVFLSHASGNKTQKPGTKQYENKDPLPFSDKLAFVDVSFPAVTVGDSNVKTVMDVMKKLQADGYTDVVMVAGSDRVNDFTELLNKYQGQEYDFNTIEVVSAGERDPDAEGADGMSASKMRAAVRAGDFESFKQGAASPQIAKPMFDMLTKILKQNPMPGDAFNEEVLEMVTKKQIDDLEDQNHHSEVATLLAKHFGTDKEQKLVAKINALHSKRGNIEHDEQIARDKIIKKYYSKVTEAQAVEGLSKQDSLMGVKDPVISISDKNGKPVDRLKMSDAAKKYKFNMNTIRPQFQHQDKVKHGQFTLSAPMNGQPMESASELDKMHTYTNPGMSGKQAITDMSGTAKELDVTIDANASDELTLRGTKRNIERLFSKMAYPSGHVAHNGEYKLAENLDEMDMTHVLINMHGKVQGYTSNEKDAKEMSRRTKSTIHPIKKKVTDKTLEKMNALNKTPKELKDLGIIEEGMDTHCSDKCCGSDVTREDCTCSSDCDHCNCNSVNESKEEFKPHTMYDKNGKAHDAKTEKQHLDMKAKGWSHDKPKEEVTEDEFRDGHDLELLKQVSAQIAQDVANNDYTAIDDLLKNVSEAEMRGFLSEMESTVNELIISKPAKRSKDDDEYEVDSKFPNLKTKKRPSHFDRRKALARMVPKMQNILSNVGEMDLTKEQLHGVLSKASKLMIEIAIAQKQEVVENLYSLNKDDVMKSEILVKGVGRYSVEGLMKNISEKLQDLSNESNSMEPFNYKNIKSKLDSGIVNVMLDSLIQAYDDLENARRKGGAASRSIPKDIFDDVMLQELEITQGTALKVLDNVANRSDKKPFPIRMKDGTVIDVSPALANEIINMYDSGGDVMQKKIMGLLSSGLGFKKLIDAAKQKNRTLR